MRTNLINSNSNSDLRDDQPFYGAVLDKNRDNSGIDTNNLVQQINSSTQRQNCCLRFPARYSLALWAFFGFLCLYAMRVNLSVAIVAMVVPENGTNQTTRACPVEKKNSSSSKDLNHEFHWTPWEQGIILGSFFYGYVVTQVVGGNLAEKFGGKWIFGGGICIAGILTLLTPVAARLGLGALIAVRILIGMAEGPAFPTAAALWGKWIPTLERSIVPPAAQTGSNFGIIFTTPTVSLLIEAGFLGGWPSAFYIYGSLSCIWFIGWCFFAFNSPEEHPRISNEERAYLNSQIVTNPFKNRATPWREIVRCAPLYGIAIMHICNNYIYYTLLTSLPTYFSTILNFNLHESGFLFALPYIAQLVTTLVIGQIVDRIRARKLLSVTVLRKTQTIIGAVGSSLCLVVIGYVGCNHVVAVVFCVLSVGFLGFLNCGALICHLDIAPNYAGTLVGITNSIAAIPGFVGPAVVGAITNNNQTVAAWRLIFDISAGIGIFGCIAYCILFNGEEQKWNRLDYKNDLDE